MNGLSLFEIIKMISALHNAEITQQPIKTVQSDRFRFNYCAN
jgi:hypothetical protein